MLLSVVGFCGYDPLWAIRGLHSTTIVLSLLSVLEFNFGTSLATKTILVLQFVVFFYEVLLTEMHSPQPLAIAFESGTKVLNVMRKVKSYKRKLMAISIHQSFLLAL